MNQSLEYTVNVRDMVNLANDSRSRLSKIVHALFALFCCAAGIVEFSSHGISTSAVLWFCMASIGVVWIPITLLIFPLFCRRVNRLGIFDEGIRTEWRGESHLIPWTSFRSKNAIEDCRHNFILNCGRGLIVIPKRAFGSPEDLVEFREFVGLRLNQSDAVTTEPLNGVV